MTIVSYINTDSTVLKYLRSKLPDETMIISS